MENILLTIHLIVAVAMVLAILMQRSEGGALGIGGGPTGMMSARGAADFLTRTTKWLAIIFLANSLALSWVASQNTEDTGALDLLEQTQAEVVVQEEVVPDVPVVPEDGE